MKPRLQSEHIRLLSEAAREIPGRPHISTVTRWYLRGVKGVKLETILIGGRRYTSTEAIQRFIERLSGPQCGPPCEDAAGRQAEDKQADNELSRLGF